MNRASVAGFVVAWDIDGEHSQVLPTYVAAVLAVREAEISTAGNVTGTIYAVSARPYQPTKAEWDAAVEAVGADRAGRRSS
jgi:hypothetical protein